MINIEDLKKIVEDFYSSLYKKNDLDEAKQEEYLKFNNRLKISMDDKNFLEEPIKIDEIKDAIKKQKLQKAPGPDGLPVAYYKTFGEILQAPKKIYYLYHL